MSPSHEHTDNFFIGQSSILDANLRLLFRAFHYETPCIPLVVRQMMGKNCFFPLFHYLDG